MRTALSQDDWLAFPGDWSDEAARVRFEDRFGYAAEQLTREKGLVYVGPIVKEEPEATALNKH